MTSFAIVFLCNILTFMLLLEERYKLFATAITFTAVLILSLVSSGLISLIADDAFFRGQITVVSNCFFCFVASLFLFKNNALQNLYIALLSLTNFTFFSYFTELVLGLLSPEVSGVPAALISATIYILFTVCIILCYYRVLHYFSDRGISKFVIGMVLIQIFSYALALGCFDIFFWGNIFAERTLFVILSYLLNIFIYRSVYHGARFRERTLQESSRQDLLAVKAQNYQNLVNAIQTVKTTAHTANYAMDSVHILVQDGHSDKVYELVQQFKSTINSNRMVHSYSDNPYINAVIAAKAVFCEFEAIDFEVNVNIDDTAVKTAEICMIIDELMEHTLNQLKDVSDASRRMRLTIFPGDGTLHIELIYSPYNSKTIRGHGHLDLFRSRNLSEIVLSQFSETTSSDSLHLPYTMDILSRYNGTMGVTVSGNSSVISININY